ncbi:hypothetical protein B0H13DRAFT_1888507 [Mycena leptocephala]|nr:hypothetical protein B0H13DRAFT_1888507 [Mycena leptocephala]
MRKQEREQQEVEIATGLGIGDDLYDQPLGQDEGEDSDHGFGLDTERETLFKIRYEAIRRHVERLENTRVVNLNTVHKLSQLYLVLEDYKTDDAKRFRVTFVSCPNLRFPSRKNSGPLHLLERGQRKPNARRPAASHCTCICGVRRSTGWVSAGMVVNATRRVMVAFLDHHDKIIRWPNAVFLIRILRRVTEEFKVERGVGGEVLDSPAEPRWIFGPWDDVAAVFGAFLPTAVAVCDFDDVLGVRSLLDLPPGRLTGGSVFSFWTKFLALRPIVRGGLV